MSALTITITGAAGNLGGMLARQLADSPHHLHLTMHHKDVTPALQSRDNVEVYKVDLANPQTLLPALQGTDVVVHFAGVLFKPRPEKFLPTTNTGYFANLLQAAVAQKVRRVILISFPHVEGETTPDHPACGSVDGCPQSAHARTRLEEERMLLACSLQHGIEAVILRVGMVYGKGVLMIDAAQWLARHYLLGVWRKPTYIHLISRIDFVQATIAAIESPTAKGIYHLGDDGVQTLQSFLDDITSYRGHHKPWRMPVWMIMTAARVCECFARIFGTRSPLTVDFVRIGMASYYADTSRMRKELLPTLQYKNYREGMELF